MRKGCIPTPGIGADHLNAALGQVKRCFGAHAAALIGEVVGAIYCAGLNENDIERLQLMTNPRELRLHLSSADDMAVRAIRKVEFHAGAEEQVQRCLVDRRGRGSATIGRRMIMPRRVHMRAIVRGKRQRFDRPTLAIGQVFAG